MSRLFDDALKFGKVAESAIARWLISRGNYVLPAYEIVDSKFQGPQFFGSGVSFVTPDMLVFGKLGAVWIEAKHKNAFTWHRITKRFVTGIDRHHWMDYLQVAERSRIQCWLMFNHKGGKAKDSPESPSGLYGGDIEQLKHQINHEHSNHGKSGMVYWSIDSLTRFSDCLT